MYAWILFLILFLTLTLSALSLAAAGIVCRCCRQEQREQERHIARTLRAQERLVRELERMRSEKRHLEQVLLARLPAWDATATTVVPAGTQARFDLPYGQQAP